MNIKEDNRCSEREEWRLLFLCELFSVEHRYDDVKQGKGRVLAKSGFGTTISGCCEKVHKILIEIERRVSTLSIDVT